MPSNTETVKAAVEAINSRDWSTLKGMWHADGVERFPDTTARGPEEIVAYFQATVDALPDMHIEPEAFAEEGDSVFLRHRITGTHTGGLFKGIAPTGKRIDVPGIDHFVLRDGKFASNFVVFDQMDIGRQLGLLPPEDSGPDKALKVAFNGVTAVKQRLAGAK